MLHQDTSEFYQWLQAKLAKKGYNPVGTVQPLDVAFFKLGALSLPYVIAVVDASQTTNTPTEIFERVKDWFKQLHGRTGAGCLLFVDHGAPSITAIEEIQKIGGYITAGAHDLHSGKHWLSDHLNWRNEIYGE